MGSAGQTAAESDWAYQVYGMSWRDVLNQTAMMSSRMHNAGAAKMLGPETTWSAMEGAAQNKLASDQYKSAWTGNILGQQFLGGVKGFNDAYQIAKQHGFHGSMADYQALMTEIGTERTFADSSAIQEAANKYYGGDTQAMLNDAMTFQEATLGKEMAEMRKEGWTPGRLADIRGAFKAIDEIAAYATKHNIGKAGEFLKMQQFVYNEASKAAIRQGLEDIAETGHVSEGVKDILQRIASNPVGRAALAAQGIGNRMIGSMKEAQNFAKFARSQGENVNPVDLTGSRAEMDVWIDKSGGVHLGLLATKGGKEIARVNTDMLRLGSGAVITDGMLQDLVAHGTNSEAWREIQPYLGEFVENGHLTQKGEQFKQAYIGAVEKWGRGEKFEATEVNAGTSVKIPKVGVGGAYQSQAQDRYRYDKIAKNLDQLFEKGNIAGAINTGHQFYEKVHQRADESKLKAVGRMMAKDLYNAMDYIERKVGPQFGITPPDLTPQQQKELADATVKGDVKTVEKLTGFSGDMAQAYINKTQQLIKENRPPTLTDIVDILENGHGRFKKAAQWLKNHHAGLLVPDSDNPIANTAVGLPPNVHNLDKGTTPEIRLQEARMAAKGKPDASFVQQLVRKAETNPRSLTRDESQFLTEVANRYPELLPEQNKTNTVNIGKSIRIYYGRRPKAGR